MTRTGSITIEYHDGRGHSGVSDPMMYNDSAGAFYAAFVQAAERSGAFEAEEK
jgi:hypothetical protein